MLGLMEESSSFHTVCTDEAGTPSQKVFYEGQLDEQSIALFHWQCDSPEVSLGLFSLFLLPGEEKVGI
jgi:hypothetical protein